MALVRLNNQSISSVTALPSGVGGKVLQVVTGTYADLTSTSTTFTEFTSLSITKISASNKVLVGFYGTCHINSNSNTNWTGGSVRVYVGGSVRFNSAYRGGILNDWVSNGFGCNWIDDNGEASTTYSFRVACIGADTSSFGISGLHEGTGTMPQLITLTELAS